MLAANRLLGRRAAATARCVSIAVRIDDSRRPYSRTRCSSCTTNATSRSAGGSGRPACRPRRSDPRHVRVGSQARAARTSSDSRRQPPEIFDERQLQHAGPRPQLADRQRRDALVAVDEHGELLAVDPAVAVAHELDGHRVDPRVARLLARRRASAAGGSRCAGRCWRMSAISDVTRWKLSSSHSAAGVTDLPGPDIVRQRPIGVAQHARVVIESGEDVAGAAPRAGVDGEARRERQRPLFQPLDAQQFVAERLVLNRHGSTTSNSAISDPPLRNARAVRSSPALSARLQSIQPPRVQRASIRGECISGPSSQWSVVRVNRHGCIVTLLYTEPFLIVGFVVPTHRIEWPRPSSAIRTTATIR